MTHTMSLGRKEAPRCSTAVAAKGVELTGMKYKKNKTYIFRHVLALGNHISSQFIIILSGPCQHNSLYLLEANFAGSDTPVKSTGTQHGF